METKEINGHAVKDMFDKKRKEKEKDNFFRLDITLQERLTFIYTTSEYHALSVVMTKFKDWPVDVAVKTKLYDFWFSCQEEVAKEINLLCDYAVLPYGISNLPFAYRATEAGHLYNNIYLALLNPIRYPELADILEKRDCDQWGYIKINDRFAIGRDTLCWFKHLVHVRSAHINARDGWPINSHALQVAQQFSAITQLFSECVDQAKAGMEPERGERLSVAAVPLYCETIQKYVTMTVDEYMAACREETAVAEFHRQLHAMRDIYQLKADMVEDVHGRMAKTILVMLALLDIAVE